MSLPRRGWPPQGSGGSGGGGGASALDDLTDVTITDTDGVFLVGTGSGFVGESDATARASLGLGASDDVSFSTVAVGTTVRFSENGSGDAVIDDGAGGSVFVIFSEQHSYDLGIYQPTAARLGIGTATGNNAGLELEFDATGLLKAQFMRTGNLDSLSLTIFPTTQILSFGANNSNSGIRWFDDPGIGITQRTGITEPSAGVVRFSTTGTSQDGTVELGVLNMLERSSDPSPSDGQAAIWVSDGTGSGDAGDVMISSNQGGTTKTTTLLDWSAL